MAIKKDPQQAKILNEEGLKYYESWEMDKAVSAFKSATKTDPQNPEYHLNLARAYARASDYQQAISALGNYLRYETDENVSARYERLFSSALDDVETRMIDTMKKMDVPIQLIGKGIQMWLEYRITMGRRPLNTPEPQVWAAALTYAVIKVNFAEVKRADVASAYQVSENSLQQKYNELIGVLDLMPADYRYFAGEKNPLDKLVEAAQILEDLDRRFQAEE